MRLKNGVEQAICILFILSIPLNKEPIKSFDMSGLLGVSDSYLKKILRKLVVSGLIVSESGKKGGFKLAKKLESITLLDIYKAIEGDHHVLHVSHLAQKIFPDKEIADQAEQSAINTILEAEKLFLEKLATYNFSDWHTQCTNEYGR